MFDRDAIKAQLNNQPLPPFSIMDEGGQEIAPTEVPDAPDLVREVDNGGRAIIAAIIESGTRPDIGMSIVLRALQIMIAKCPNEYKAGIIVTTRRMLDAEEQRGK